MLAPILAIAFLALAHTQAAAQPGPFPGGRPSPEDIERLRAARDAARGAQPSPPESQKKDEKPDDKENKDDAKKDDEEKKEDATPTVKRSTEPPAKVDREELKVKPDKDGRVQFSFYGQKWEDVLQWYADVSNLSFNWRELPEGYLNLTARRKYSLPETGDMLNAQLLAHGFTMIKTGDVLLAMKIEKLDPSLVPRIDPDDLEDYLPHDFVRVRFSLPESMDAAKAAEDVKILLSPNAKVQPLLATKRLHVIDAVVNLRSVRDLIYAEQAAVTEDIRPTQFMIRHRRADYVADQVMIVLGLDPTSRKSPQELQIEQQRMQLMMQMAQQKKDVSKMLKADGPDVFLAVNQRRNSIIVNAPPAEMPKIKRTIEMFDVPDDGGEVYAPGQLEFKKYVTATASTDSVVSALKEIGGLHPLTQLQSDKKNRTIYATATASDHAKIQRMIDKLDGSGRQMHVIWLNRSSPADQIAGTITVLMGGNEEKEDNNRRSRSRYFGYFDDDDEPDPGNLRVQPDIENNRLLLWATQSEYEEVQRLLTQIGAVATPNQGNPSKLRVLDPKDPEEVAKLLERLQGSWTGANPIEIHGLPTQPKEAPPTEGSERTEDKDAVKDRLTRAPRLSPFILAQYEALQVAESVPNDSGEQASPASESPPVKITVTPDGRLIITSDDPAALDRVEELMGELETPAPEFVTYYLENTRASLVDILLKEYFEDELQGQTESVYDQWGEYQGKRDKTTGPTTLGRRRLLRFIWDSESNTIVVQNASAAQLKIIDQLIKIYDKPVAEDSVAARRTEVVPLVYSRASQIATSLKEVYRDLLSAKDKEFQGREGEQKTTTERYYRFSGGSEDSDPNKKSAPLKLEFEGALSVGVDEISNTLIISAQEQVFEEVVEVVRKLDEKAKPNTVVQVHEVRGSLPSDELQDALEDALGQPWPGGKPFTATSASGGERSGDGRRDRDRRRGRRDD